MPIERYAQTARYAKIVVRDSTVYLAGLIAREMGGDIADQTRDIFVQIDELLGSVGTDKSKLLTMNCWIKDFGDYGRFNEIYDQWIDRENLPARATVRADLLDPRLRIEIMATAAK